MVRQEDLREANERTFQGIMRISALSPCLLVGRRCLVETPGGALLALAPRGGFGVCEGGDAGVEAEEHF